MAAHHESSGTDARTTEKPTAQIERRIRELAALHQTAEALQEGIDPRLAEVLAREREIVDSLVGTLARANAEIEEYQRQLRGLASELLLIEERGRREIAQELHDHLGQALAFVRMKTLQFGSNAVFCGFEHDIEHIVSLLDQTIRYTRTLTCEISPPVLYELGLGPAVDWLAEEFERKHGLAVSTSVTGDCRAVPKQLSVMVFQCVRELLANAGKHASADRVQVAVRCGGDRVTVEVIDDGVGFEVGAAGARGRHGFGLFSIRERVTYLGGRVVVESAPGDGTRVRLEVPANGEETP